ncbi:MAG: hypothetical protein ABEJ75_04485 [Candidatus Nanohaloarchaea archaeon]
MADQRELQDQTSGPSRRILNLIALTVTLMVFSGTVVAQPTFSDTESLNETYIQETQVEAYTYNFTISATDGTVKKPSLAITVNYTGGYHTFDDSYFTEHSGDLYTFNPGDDWTTYSGIDEPPASGETLYFNLTAKDDGGWNSTGYGWVRMYVDGDSPNYANRTPKPGSATNNPQQLISMDITDEDGQVDWSSVNITVSNSTTDLLKYAGTGDPHVLHQAGSTNLTINASKSPEFFYDNSDKITVNITINDTVDHQTSIDWNFYFDNQAPHDVALTQPSRNIAKMVNDNLTVGYRYNESNPAGVNVTLHDGDGNTATWVLSDEGESGPIVDQTAELDLDQPNSTTGKGITHGNVYNFTLKIYDQSGNTVTKTDIGGKVSISNIQFRKDFYQRGENATVIVYNKSALDDGEPAHISGVKIKSSDTGDTATPTLEETANNTFTAEIILSRYQGPDTDNNISVTKSDIIEATYDHLPGTATATVDESPPSELQILQPEGTIYRSTQDGDTTFSLKFNFTENGSGAEVAELVIQGTGVEFNNTDPDDSTGTVTDWILADLNNTGLAEGSYTLNLSITDKVGLTGYKSGKTLVVDNTKPEGNLTDLEGGIEGVDGSYYIQSTSSDRDLNLTLKDNNPLPTDAFYLRYNFGGTNYSEKINLTTATTEKTVNLTIDDTGLGSDEKVRLWINESDRAGNNWTSSYGSPLATYGFDGAPPETVVSANNQSCGIGLDIESHDDGAGVTNFTIYRDGEKIKSFNKDTATDIRFRYFDPVKNGTYVYNVTSIDVMGNRINTTVVAKSKLGEIEMDVSTDFDEVYKSDATLYSNRSMDIRVTDSCTAVNNGEGNIINGEKVKFSTSGKEGWINLTNDQSTTDSEGFAEANLTAKLGGAAINITSEVNVKTINGWNNQTVELQIQLEEKRYELEKGWNFLSIPLYLGDKTVEEVVSSISGTTIEKIWGYNASTDTWKVYDPDKADNSLEELKAGKGYWVNTTGEGRLEIHGTLAEVKNPDSYDDLAPDQLTLYEGWNMIGFRRWMNISKFTSAFSIDAYYAYSSINSDEGIYYEENNATTGEGYWVYMDNKTSAGVAQLR